MLESKLALGTFRIRSIPPGKPLSTPSFPPSLILSSTNTSYTLPASQNSWLIGPAADPRAPWLHAATAWLPAFLSFLETRWPSPGGLAITEFGFAEPFESQKTLLQDILYDPVRMKYFHDYMRSVLFAMAEGRKVIGTWAWSFVDNFEVSEIIILGSLLMEEMMC